MRSGKPRLRDIFFEGLNKDKKGLRLSKAIQDCQIEDNDVTGINKF